MSVPCVSLCVLRDFVPSTPSTTNVVSSTWDLRVRVRQSSAHTHVGPVRSIVAPKDRRKISQSMDDGPRPGV